MKKIIAILLVLVVGFAAFAETGVGSTTLTLGSSVSGKLYHGFTAADPGSANGIKSALSAAESGDNSYAALDLESDAAQSVGFYSLYTTGNAQATVKFTANPLTADVNGTMYYVPYALSYTEEGGNNVTVSGSPIGSANTATTTPPAAATATTVMTTSSNGLRWDTISLDVTFDGTGNATFGLPEATFSGTIVAAVTAN